MHAVSVAALVTSLLTVVTKATFLSALSACPDLCYGKPENWTVYSSLDRLYFCPGPKLLDFSLYNPLEDPDTTARIRTCSVQNDKPNRTSITSSIVHARSSLFDAKRTHTGLSLERQTTTTSNGKVRSSDVHGLLTQIQNFLTAESNFDDKVVFGHASGIAIGIYTGESIDTSAILHHLADEILKEKDLPSTVFQLCGGDRTAESTFGAIIDTSGDIATAQKSVAAWNRGICSVIDTQEAPLTAPIDAGIPLIVQRSGVPSNELAVDNVSDALSIQDTPCRTVSVSSGDSCGTLASKCGISPSDFLKYNPDPNLCSTLQIGQKVCCSPGSIPVPKPNPDGSCAAYTVRNDDTCASIAASNGLKVSDISKFNDKIVWGWFGCKDLQAGLIMCLSQGSQPMPAVVPNAVCGPTAPNTKPPSKITPDTLAALNPCPLHACCNIWGQCGITAEYCTAETGPTGNPGTAPPNKNGCISNCGTKITNNGEAPSYRRSVGYYESWNWDRPCLNMRAASIDTIKYTHVHWGFGLIGSDFSVSVNYSFNQWENFTALEDAKKIISFGGWGYSTDPATYDVLRSAMEPANVNTFVDNIDKFVTTSGLDGVDIDWEYPGAPDIPGIPPGLPSDGPNYLNFLKVLRNKLAASKTMSIAAPASYWYLKAFPIANMSSYLDYIVYMTYDLHGQWDYGNQWSQEGCLGGNCLRSHVNSTETEYVLAMITKAGVPSNKIVVGVSSYGRSFGMTTRGCTGPDCTFGGSNTQSTAEPGDCTQTAGYISNYEINVIIEMNETSTGVRSFYDSASDSNILVYNQTNWVAYMDDTTKASRTKWYQDLNFAGTVDWALDLQADTGDDGDPNGDEDGDPPPINLQPCTESFPTMEALDAAAGRIPLHCSAQYTLDTLSQLFGAALKNYTDMINNGYDKKFQTYAKAVADGASNNVYNWITTNGSYAFKCIVAEASFCCGTCNKEENECKYCRNDKGDSCQKECNPRFGCLYRNPRDQENQRPIIQDTLPIWKWVNETEPCPPDYSQRGYGPGDPAHPADYEQSVFWTLQDSKADQFYADLFANTGVPKNKTKIGDRNRGNDCAPSNHRGDGDNCWADGYDYGIVIPDGYGVNDVTNPKDLVTKALSLSNDLGPQIVNVADQLRLFAFMGNMNDVVDAVSMPVLMFVEAVDSMAKVAETADEIDEAERKAIILAFIGAILFFIPIVGEIAGSIEAAGDLGAIISLIGDAGNVAFDTWTIVKDPDNAPLAIMGLIFAPASLADVVKITRAANIRRGMEDADIAKLGERIAGGMGTIRKINGKCHPS